MFMFCFQPLSHILSPHHASLYLPLAVTLPYNVHMYCIPYLPFSRQFAVNTAEFVGVSQAATAVTRALDQPLTITKTFPNTIQ
jgi:hypothetical protein